MNGAVCSAPSVGAKKSRRLFVLTGVLLPVKKSSNSSQTTDDTSPVAFFARAVSFSVGASSSERGASCSGALSHCVTRRVIKRVRKSGAPEAANKDKSTHAMPADRELGREKKERNPSLISRGGRDEQMLRRVIMALLQNLWSLLLSCRELEMWRADCFLLWVYSRKETIGSKVLAPSGPCTLLFQGVLEGNGLL